MREASTCPNGFDNRRRFLGPQPRRFGSVSAATLAIDEFRARRALLRTHAELLATQTLLSDSSRHAERVRIARGLHDDLGHQLTALSLQLEVASQIARDGPVAECVKVSQRLTRELLTKIRDVVGSLRAEPPVALEVALRALASGIPHPRIHVTLPDLTVEHPAHVEAIFHCVQEAITNAVRHADAHNVWVELVVGADGIDVRARDDGHGTETISPGHGLVGMPSVSSTSAAACSARVHQVVALRFTPGYRAG